MCATLPAGTFVDMDNYRHTNFIPVNPTSEDRSPIHYTSLDLHIYPSLISLLVSVDVKHHVITTRVRGGNWTKQIHESCTSDRPWYAGWLMQVDVTLD